MIIKYKSYLKNTVQSFSCNTSISVLNNTFYSLGLRLYSDNNKQSGYGIVILP